VSGPAQLNLALVGVTHPFRGGISHYSTLLCRALRERHTVRFYSLYRQYPALFFPGRSQIDESAAALAVDHEPTIDSCNPYTWLRTARRIIRQRPDLLVISWWHPFFAPAFGTIAHLARRAGIPSCFLCHNAVPHERSPVDRALLRYAFSAARVFIVHSRQDHDDLLELRPRATVLHHPHPSYAVFAGADTVPETEAKRRLQLTGKRVLLFFGFVREYKGLDVLLEAVQQLDPAEGHHLLVVGEFYDDRARYRAALDNLTQRGQLTLVDRYVPNEEIGLYFAAADLVAVPYLSATQSGVIQIAYGFGKPVVATAVGGIPEVVAEGRTGYLVPAGDAAAIANAVRRYFTEGDPEEFRREIAAENRRYSWDAMVDTVERAHAATGAR
jgi:glycosyltransferase involved in cell wall biosynthesis